MAEEEYRRARMDKILVVFTGGTIGSCAENGIIAADKSAGFRLLEAYRAQTDCPADFDAIAPLNILSENLLPAHWEALSDALATARLADYDGVIVAHGTDTLPYTAAMLSFLARGIALPVVLVSASRPLGAAGSNALANFTAAVRFISNERLPGVFAVFRNSTGETLVHLAARLTEADPRTDDFLPPFGVAFGERRGNAFVRFDSPQNPTPQQLCDAARTTAVAPVRFPRAAALVAPYPGLDYGTLRFSPDKTCAVLHGLYHSSTACVEPEPHSLLTFAAGCASAGIPLWLHDCRHFADESVYRTAAALRAAGVFTLAGITRPCALAKLTAAYSQTVLPPETFMRQNLAFEFVEI
ncbi:MAG: asparaginase domain-containing protein [Oscillospiraceae bacterium]